MSPKISVAALNIHWMSEHFDAACGQMSCGHTRLKPLWKASTTLDGCVQQVTHILVDIAVLVVVSDRCVGPFSFQVNSLQPLTKVSFLLYLQELLSH